VCSAPPRDQHEDATLPSAAEREAIRQDDVARVDRSKLWVPLRDGTVRRCPGDGDCLYWALGEGKQGLTGTDARKMAMQWVADRCIDNEAVGEKLRRAILAEFNETPSQYVQRMRWPLLCARAAGSAHWGGPVELAAWASLSHREVWVFREEGDRWLRISAFEPSTVMEQQRRPITVLFSTGHYDCLDLADSAFQTKAA